MELEVVDLDGSGSLDADLILYEGIDLDDDTRLEDLVEIVSQLLSLPRHTILISALTDEEWAEVVQLAISRKRIVESSRPYVQVLPHPDDPFQLLVNPECVRQLNGKGVAKAGAINVKAVAAVIHSLLRFLPCQTPPILRRGLKDLIAVEAARRLPETVELTPFYPKEAVLVQNLCRILSLAHGYSTLDWQVVLYKSPDKFLLALRKTPFAEAWVRAAKQHPQIGPLLTASDGKPRQVLMELLCLPERQIDDDFVHLLWETALRYLQAEPSALR